MSILRIESLRYACTIIKIAFDVIDLKNFAIAAKKRAVGFCNTSCAVID